MLEAALEGLLFVVGDDGLSLDKMVTLLEIPMQEAKELVIQLQKKYDNPNSGIRISFLGNTFKLTTKEEQKEYYEKLVTEDDSSLSQAALETLAIIAYNEPVTRSRVDDLRGVSSSPIVRKLAAKGLIKELSRAETPGRPILYGTTHEFLDYFNLSSKDDLPNIDFDEVIEEDSDLFTSKYVEQIDQIEVLI